MNGITEQATIEDLEEEINRLTYWLINLYRAEETREGWEDTMNRSDAIEGVCDLLAWIAQEREVSALGLSEGCVLVQRVQADQEEGGVTCSNLCFAVTQRLKFARSVAGKGFGEPGQHHSLLPPVLGEAVDRTVGARQREVGCRVADGQAGRRAASDQAGQGGGAEQFDESI